jgi:hypothetical protein
MMLNSEQTVQELIEEHRRKQAQATPAEKKSSHPAPKRSPGSSAPPGSLSGPKGPVLQPPRAGVPSRGRMGGTMMGVAPQAGGVVPPASGLPRPVEVAPTTPPPAPTPAPTPHPPARSDAVAPEEEARTASESASAAPGPSPADPLAGTVAVPVVPQAPASDAPLVAGAVATPPVVRPPSGEARNAAPPVAASSGAEEGSGAAVPTSEQRAAETQPPRARAIAATAALPQQPEVAAKAVASTSAPARIRPLDVVLVVCTLGLYGIVLWFKQRKPA